MSSRQGAAMICTPIGIGSSGTGTAATGNPIKEIGWVWTPILARTGNSTPSSTKFTCPSFGATQGVAGARRTSTDLNSSATCARYQRRNHRACDQAITHRGIEILRPCAQAIEMKRGAFAGRDDVGGGAGAGGFRNFDHAADAKRFRDTRYGFAGLGKDILLEIAAGERDAQIADALRQ